MLLTVTQPAGVFLEAEARLVQAQGMAGRFGLLPRHVDGAFALSPGIMRYEEPDGTEAFLALDEGMLVKRGQDVLVAVRRAVRGDLGRLRAAVEAMLEEGLERERQARTAGARLEAGFVRKMVGFGGH